MKENRLLIQIRRSPKDIFNFCLDPKNTPKWIDSVIIEETNDWPPKIGTIYRNRNNKGVWSEYKVIALESPAMFEFIQPATGYHVRYTLRPLDAETTELEYYEWMKDGYLAEPFSFLTLHKLKEVLEPVF